MGEKLEKPATIPEHKTRVMRVGMGLGGSRTRFSGEVIALTGFLIRQDLHT